MVKRGHAFADTRTYTSQVYSFCLQLQENLHEDEDKFRVGELKPSCRSDDK